MKRQVELTMADNQVLYDPIFLLVQPAMLRLFCMCMLI